jgi:YidC/Oxa1 family membrane protein insertase
MWEEIIIKPFINVLLVINSLVGNFGIAIILFTLLIRAVTHPLMVQQIKGASGMQALQKDKRWIDAQAKYKGDKEKLAQEQMKLYKELGINPFASCLPLLIQFPIIIGLYQAIIQAMVSTPLEMLNLSRLMYPGINKLASIIPINSTFLWMDLGQPDTSLKLFGLAFGIPVMAIVVLATSWIQSRLMQPPADPSNQQASMMTGMMNIYMPLLMGYMGLTLASGLALYFVTSNLVGIGQYALLGRVNWKMINPFYKQPKLVVDAKAKKPAPARPEELPEPTIHPSNMAPNGKKPVPPAIKGGKKANITKPVKSGSSKTK